MFALSTRNSRAYADARFWARRRFVFGCETRGLPPGMLEEFDDRSAPRDPDASGKSQLNLSNAVAVVVMESLASMRFRGSASL